MVIIQQFLIKISIPPPPKKIEYWNIVIVIVIIIKKQVVSRGSGSCQIRVQNDQVENQ